MIVPVDVDTPAFLPAVVVVPIPTECLLTEVVPSVISTEPPTLTSPVIVAIPVTRRPSLAVITPTAVSYTHLTLPTKA